MTTLEVKLMVIDAVMNSRVCDYEENPDELIKNLYDWVMEDVQMKTADVSHLKGVN